jgi:hypothetical protein
MDDGLLLILAAGLFAPVTMLDKSSWPAFGCVQLPEEAQPVEQRLTRGRPLKLEAVQEGRGVAANAWIRRRPPAH